MKHCSRVCIIKSHPPRKDYPKLFCIASLQCLQSKPQPKLQRVIVSVDMAVRFPLVIFAIELQLKWCKGCCTSKMLLIMTYFCNDQG
ncbi:hypothetical protein CEXT_810341 [Caerostris extrusa]|uniref:Uncharacterized protein n=1 Tax=Caerostris extrusa TaxID=172846 RepID=A0AAV4UDX9_CAEEX|nr:hypothetical protein CEXT_810341 [Caerostris extrusa]